MLHGVHTEYWYPLILVLLSKTGNLLELRIPVFHVLERLGLDEGVFFETSRSDHLADVIVRNVYAVLFKSPSNLRCVQAYPPD